MKKVHEQLKALSNPKKRRKSMALDLEVDDPLFLPPSLAIEDTAITKKKVKKKVGKPQAVANPAVKKPNKVRPVPPAKKASSNK